MREKKNGKESMRNYVGGTVLLNCSFYLVLFVLCRCCCMGFSLAAERGGCSLVVVHRLLTAAAFLVAEHGSSSHGFITCSTWAR